MANYKVIYEFDPFELTGVDTPSRGRKREALEEIADYTRQEILAYVGDASSPVSGGAWKQSLSKEYAEMKEKISSSDEANLELTGDMLDALETRIVNGKIQVGWFGGEQAAKAYNHNTGDTLPQRQSIPEKGQTFKRDIVKGMREIAQEFLDEEK